eukprot:TRINITY_DN843_c0_g1_i1.p5 TRINITY_DN843_c0_g1~~TRINITY_DN843_c0_g1_i1.p5  ORF type:complete len:143 (-),score=35.09 TRINITY_DN843_c0_g1_i1:104-532(-)
MGYMYVVACTLGGIAGFWIGTFAVGGAPSTAGFWTLAVCWVTSTLMAVQCARSGHFLEHQAWMIRSYALTSAATTLRLYLLPAVLLALSGFGTFTESYSAIAWLCFVPNIIVGEILVHRIVTPKLIEKRAKQLLRAQQQSKS